ncbi:MAG: DUF3106 domain-containing protein [Puniceicoccales bacterium]
MRRNFLQWISLSLALLLATSVNAGKPEVVADTKAVSEGAHSSQKQESEQGWDHKRDWQRGHNNGDGLGEIDTDQLFDQLEQEEQGEISLEQLRSLESFLNMPPKQLAQVRAAIERIEAMSPEERDALRDKIREFREMREEKMHKLRKAYRAWKTFDPEQRWLVHRYVVSLPPEQAKELKQIVIGLNEDERRDYFLTLLEKARAAEAAGKLPDLVHWKDGRPRHYRSDEHDSSRKPPPPPPPAPTE